MAVRLTLVFADYNKERRFSFDVEEPAASMALEDIYRKMGGDDGDIIRFPLDSGGEVVMNIDDLTYVALEPIKLGEE